MPLLCPTNSRIVEMTREFAAKKEDLYKYLRNVFIKKRQPGATHVMIFMISEERRKKKPYCQPVQYIHYHSIRDQYMRDMTVTLKQHMIAHGLKPIGMILLHESTCSGEKWP
jgi:hypothetical protein